MRAATSAASSSGADRGFAGFLAAVLAPLPAGTEPASTPAFRRQAQADADGAWHHRWLVAEAMRHSYKAMNFAKCRENQLGTDLADEAKRLERDAFRDFIRAVDRLMCWPAPNLQALAWKLKNHRLDGGRDGWEAAINADEDRFGMPRTAWSGEP